jgi:glycosyltransferase involved in cell wall biosynthesis
MRIVQALGSSRKGGAEGFFVRLATALHNRGISQMALVRRGSWSHEALVRNAVPCQTAAFAGALDFTTGRAFKAALSNPPADVAITWMRRAASACPRGRWVHIGRLGNYYGLKPFAHCDHLVGITPGIVDYIKAEGWPPDRVSYLPNFAPEVTASPLPRSVFQTPDDAPLIVWLGRMEHEKGPDVVLKALAQIPNAIVWMAGDGGYMEQAQTLARDLGISARVRFLGWRDDIHALLESADLFVCASRTEAHGNIILEAWSHGVPIVATRSPGPSYLIEDGVTGILVPNEDHDALAAAASAMLGNRDRARMIGEAGRQHFRATYAEDRVVAQYLDLCRLLVEQKSGNVQAAR